MNRKRRLAKRDIDDERASVERSAIYRAGCHELLGPGTVTYFNIKNFCFKSTSQNAPI